MATKKKDGRKTKRFALRASVNGTNHWESLTDEQKQERINRMQAGRKKWQEEREQIDAWNDYANELYTYDPKENITEGIMKPRSLSLVNTPDLDLKDAEKISDFDAMTAFKRVATHRRARALVVRLKELCLEEDGVETCADNEFVGISWLHLQALVYKIMKEMDDQ